MGEIITRVNEGIELIEREGGQLFGTDAFLLYAFARPMPKKRAVELGAGSGIVSLLCAQKEKFAHIDAVEIQPEMAELARSNAERNGLSEKVSVACADLREWQGRADAVFCNPPYVKSGAGIHNPDGVKNVSRREIYGGIDDFCACAARTLNHGGYFYCVWRPDRLTDLFDSMRRRGIEPKRLINVYPEPDAPTCLVLVEGRRGGNPGALFIAPPFILNSGGIPTSECNEVYERGEFGGQYKRP